jgi:DNA-binding CsgD family transcriptional regulator
MSELISAEGTELSLGPETRGAGTWPGEPCPGPLVGRDVELSLLRGLVDPAPVASSVLFVVGDPGIGKTVLLADMAQRARSAGARVLAITGRESEANVAFAALHQLLRPVVDSAVALPERQRMALRGALGLAQVPVAPNQLMTGIAALTLLSALAEPSPLLVIVDDAHLLDRSSLDVLAFVGRRLDAERVVLILGGRRAAPLAAEVAGFPELRLDPLLASDARGLLDGQPHPPRGRARGQVLAQAAGNPLALIELAKVIAADAAAGRRWAVEPLPLSGKLAAVFAAPLAGLPAPTRAALLLAAIADSSGSSAGYSAVSGAAMGAMYGLMPDVLAPAERRGLVKVNRSGLMFSHPLVRSAIYHAAPFADRAAAHRKLADALKDQPDRRAWHLAEAALQPDERVASLLEATAAQAQCRGGAVVAALALERAAELSPDREHQARRLVSAASVAVLTGQADWVEDLAGRALAITADPELHIAARRAAGWALARTSQHVAALSVLIAVAEEAAAGRPDLALSALVKAAAVAYPPGAPASRQAVIRTLDHLERDRPSSTAAADINALRVWIRASTSPFAGRSELVQRLHGLTIAALDDPSVPGSAAWLLDEPELAVELLQEALHRLQAPGIRGASGAVLSALGWTYVDTGRWDDALAVCAEASDLAEAYQMDIIAAFADVTVAAVLAMRADPAAARARTASALARIDPAQSRCVTARARHALGLAALADGGHLVAYAQLRQLFCPDGSPLHHHVSYLGLADLAAAAVRSGRQLEGREILERALSHLGGTPSPRLDQLLGRARGILADPASAEPYFDKALSDPAGERWPFERAQLQLDYAEWMRRQRRINEAKPLLIAALDTFQRLRAGSWAHRAETELRACGVSMPGPPDPRHALSELTAQQRQIIGLASDGLTNREIADRLYLSPRTVGSHLYRSYPKLGVAGRHQLRDVITRAGARPMADPGPATD